MKKRRAGRRVGGVDETETIGLHTWPRVIAFKNTRGARVYADDFGLNLIWIKKEKYSFLRIQKWYSSNSTNIEKSSFLFTGYYETKEEEKTSPTQRQFNNSRRDYYVLFIPGSNRWPLKRDQFVHSALNPFLWHEALNPETSLRNVY